MRSPGRCVANGRQAIRTPGSSGLRKALPPLLGGSEQLVAWGGSSRWATSAVRNFFQEHIGSRGRVRAALTTGLYLPLELLRIRNQNEVALAG